MALVDPGHKITWMIIAGTAVLIAAAGAFYLFRDNLAPPPLVERLSPEAKIAAWRSANPPDLRLALALDPKSGLAENQALLARSAAVLARYLAALEQYHPPKRLPGGGIDLLLAAPEPAMLERLREMIRGGYLGFHLVHPESDSLAPAAAMGNTPPADHRVLTGPEGPLLIETAPQLTGVAITAVTLEPESGALALKIALGEAGSSRLAEITATNIGRRLAVVSRDRVLTAPTIHSKIGGGSLMISGGLTPEEAQALALALDAGGLSAPLVVTVEEAIAP